MYSSPREARKPHRHSREAHKRHQHSREARRDSRVVRAERASTPRIGAKRQSPHRCARSANQTPKIREFRTLAQTDSQPYQARASPRPRRGTDRRKAARIGAPHAETAIPALQLQVQRESVRGGAIAPTTEPRRPQPPPAGRESEGNCVSLRSGAPAAPAPRPKAPPPARDYYAYHKHKPSHPAPPSPQTADSKAPATRRSHPPQTQSSRIARQTS